MANATLKSQHYDCLCKALTRQDTLALPSEGSQATQGSAQGTCSEATHKTSWGAPPLLPKIKANDGWKRGFSSVVQLLPQVSVSKFKFLVHQARLGSVDGEHALFIALRKKLTRWGEDTTARWQGQVLCLGSCCTWCRKDNTPLVHRRREWPRECKTKIYVSLLLLYIHFKCEVDIVSGF